MNEQPYLSEEELMQLIKSAEQNPVCKAPDYLKGQILRTAAKENASQTMISSISKRQQLFIFSAKVAAAAAAAVALLIIMPEASQLEQYSQNIALSSPAAVKPKEASLLRQLNEKTNQFCFYLSDAANSIFIKEDLK